VLGGVFFIIFLATPQYPTDGEMVEAAVERGVKDVLPAHLLGDSIFIIEEGNEHPLSWFVRRSLSKILKDMGHKVFYISGKGASTLYFKVGKIGISYRELRSFPLFAKKYERQAFSRLYLTLLGKEGEILWIGDVESTLKDTVDEKSRKFLYTEGISPDIPYSRGNLMESILATLVIGALILALYTSGG